MTECIGIGAGAFFGLLVGIVLLVGMVKLLIDAVRQWRVVSSKRMPPVSEWPDKAKPKTPSAGIPGAVWVLTGLVAALATALVVLASQI